MQDLNFLKPMSEKDRNSKIGSWMVELIEQVQKFNEAREKQEKFLPHLRQVVNCFDESTKDIAVYESPGILKSSISNKKILVPDQNEIIRTMKDISLATNESREILSNLQAVDIDLSDICATLNKMENYIT